MSKLDRMEEISPEVKSRVLAAFAYASAELGMWAFSLEGEIFYTTSPNEKEFYDFFCISGCYDYMLTNVQKLKKPLMLSDSLGLNWIAEGLYENDDKIKIILLMGPFFLSRNAEKNIENKLADKVFSIKLMRQLSHSLNKIPIIYRNVISIYISMLHFALTSEILEEDILYQHEHDVEKNISNEITEKDFQDSELEIRGERIFLNAIREGNLNYAQVFNEEISFNGGFLTETGDGLRDAKNTVLVFNSLCARAAMDGGLAIPICRKMESEFANSIELCETIASLSDFNQNMIDTYVKSVHKYNNHPEISKTTAECCEYIKANAYKDISITTIANALGYSPYYFTKKFSKEMGMKITDYIRKIRVESAKIELLSTSVSIEEISAKLHFGTRNYFSRVFKEETGMSPAEYRLKKR